MSYQQIANATQCVVLAKSGPVIKIPLLKHGEDEKRAAELEQYIDDAESGLRAILKAGFFLECLAADLPHGQLGPWVESHCKNRTWRTVQRWKEIAGELGDAVGIKYKKRIEVKLHEVLALPVGKVPDELKAIREKLDDEIAGKSYRQLFLELRQSEDGKTRKRGRLKGQGGATKEQRAKAAEREEQARIDALKLEMDDFTKWADKNGDDKGIGKTRGSKEWNKLKEAVTTLAGYMRGADALATKGVNQ